MVIRMYKLFLFPLSSYFHMKRGKGAGKATLSWKKKKIQLFWRHMHVSSCVRNLWSWTALNTLCFLCLFLHCHHYSGILLLLKTHQLFMFYLSFSSSWPHTWMRRFCTKMLAMVPHLGTSTKLELGGIQKHMNFAPALRGHKVKIRVITNPSFRTRISGGQISCF